MVPTFRSDADGNLDGETVREEDIVLSGRLPSDYFTRKMFIDMYIGKGKNDPPVTQRVSDVEGDLAEVKDAVKAQYRLGWGILLTLIAVLFAVIFKK